jgi:nucleotide-binding universal stress UspA family protein
VTLSIVPNVREPENDESAGELEPIRSALDEQALTLRRQSLSFRSIAVEMECSTSTAYARVRRALRKESGESPEEVRSILSAQLDEVILRMRSILVSREATHGAATRAAEQIVSAAKAKARLVGAEAPSRQIIKLNYVSEEALAEEREQLEATLVAMGVDLSAFPTPEEIAQKLLASRPALNAGPPIDIQRIPEIQSEP